MGFPKSNRTDFELNSAGGALLKVFQSAELVRSLRWAVNPESMKKISLLVLESAEALSDPALNDPARYAGNGGFVPRAIDCYAIASIGFYRGKKLSSSTGDFACAALSSADPITHRLFEAVSTIVLSGR